jgi:hypothetical protein
VCYAVEVEKRGGLLWSTLVRSRRWRCVGLGLLAPLAPVAAMLPWRATPRPGWQLSGCFFRVVTDGPCFAAVASPLSLSSLKHLARRRQRCTDGLSVLHFELSLIQSSLMPYQSALTDYPSFTWPQSPASLASIHTYQIPTYQMPSLSSQSPVLALVGLLFSSRIAEPRRVAEMASFPSVRRPCARRGQRRRRRDGGFLQWRVSEFPGLPLSPASVPHSAPPG